jgi:hypothetical protein
VRRHREIGALQNSRDAFAAVASAAEACRPSARQKQRSREAAADVGQGDQHEAAAWPDVQGLQGRAHAAPSLGRDGELLVVVVEGLFAHADGVRRRRDFTRTAEPAPSAAIAGVSGFS